MNEEERVEEYILAHSDRESDYLRTLYRSVHVHLLAPRMAVGHVEGRLLKMLTQMIRPKCVLEIGTFSGYAALCIAEGLTDDALLYTYEVDDELEPFTRPVIENSACAHHIKFVIGDALKLVPQTNDMFDLVFLDGDKRQYIDYYEMVLPRVVSGGFIIADNTLWGNQVIVPPKHHDPRVDGITAFNDIVAHDERVEKLMLPLRDGLTLIRKK